MGRPTRGSAEAPPHRAGARDALIAAGLFLGTVALFAQVRSHGFVHYDDDQYIVANPLVRAGLSWRGLVWAFTTFHFANWHPLTWLSLMLDVQLFGLDAGWHHLASVALHAASAALLFLVLARMTGARGRSALVAALFAVHPLHVESVAWAAERKDVLSTLLGLLALGAYARYAARPGARRYLAVVVAFAASLLAKPMLVTLPFLLLLLDVWPLGRAPRVGAAAAGDAAPAGWGPLVLEKLPLLALSVASSIVTVVAQSRWGAVTGGERLGLLARAGNAAVSYVAYVEKVIWPARLAVFYPYRDAPAWEAGAAVVLLLAATAGAVVALRRAPWVTVGWGWFTGSLVPVIGLVQIGGQAMADRYTYVPAIGLFILVAWGGHALAARRPGGARAAAAAAAALLAALAAVTWRQLGVWKDHETLFRHAIAVTGPNPRAHALLAAGLREEGRPAGALPEAEEAVRLAPGSARDWTELGLVLLDLRRGADAGAAFQRAVSLDPGLAIGWSGAGLAAAGQGRLAEAEAAFRRATALDPRDALSWNELGLVLAGTGRIPEAVDAYRRALAADPSAVAAWSNLAAAYQRLGRVADAEVAFTAAVRADPATPVTWRNLGAFLAGTGRSAEAADALAQAVRRAPASAGLLRELGLAQAAAGRRDEALATAARLDGADPAGAAAIRAQAGATR